MNDNVKIAIIIGVAIVVSTIIYSNIQTKNKTLDRNLIIEKQNREDLLIQENENRLNSCINTAISSYRLTWENTCESLNREENCMLPQKTADSYNKSLSADKDRCTKLYSN